MMSANMYVFLFDSTLQSQVTMGIKLHWAQINVTYGFIVSFLWNFTKRQSKEFKRYEHTRTKNKEKRH